VACHAGDRNHADRDTKRRSVFNFRHRTSVERHNYPAPKK
jgi:hypothetical protein